MDRKLSIAEYRGSRGGYRCGYCASNPGKVSHGIWAHCLTVQDYQDLINRGWRRSGKYCYKPAMDKTCCPQYTIKCEALHFRMSKSQKKVIKRVHKYLNHDVHPGHGGGDVAAQGRENLDVAADMRAPPHALQLADTEPANTTSGNTTDAVDTTMTANLPSKNQEQPAAAASTHSTASHTKKSPRPGTGADPDKPKCKKAKLLRMERKLQKKADAKLQTQVTKPQAQVQIDQNKSVEDFLAEIIDHPAHNLEVKLVRSNPKSTEFKSTYSASYKVFKKYQMGIHRETESDCDKSCFNSFLVDSPLQPLERTDGFPAGYGSFHQQYWLDGKLVAVGVLDILPHCVSSVYLYYDPDYAFLSLGTYSALRELAFTREVHRHDSIVQFYYMGYYIQSCPKMKYKGQYYPSFLLCPESYTWQPIEKSAPKLDASKYARFDETGTKDADLPDVFSNVGILFMRQAMNFEIYKALNPRSRDDDEVKEYAGLVGKKCAERMLLFRPS